jgi:hypothetical protein
MQVVNAKERGQVCYRVAICVVERAVAEVPMTIYHEYAFDILAYCGYTSFDAL